MNINIHLSRDTAEKLLMIYRMVRDPDITCVEDYVETMLSDLISRIWDDVRNDILN